jgi:hypothetical protein
LRECAIADSVGQIGFVAYEGKGSLADGTFVIHEMELVDVMPNGQLRFALSISASIVRSRGSSGLPRYPSSQRVSRSNIATDNVIRLDMTALRIRSIARWFSPQPNSTNVMVRS